MSWLLALVVVALLGATAVVAAGRGGSMREVHDDRPDVLVPADRPLTGADLRRVRLGTAVRGYRMAEVDALLERLADELDRAGARAPQDAAHPPPGGAAAERPPAP